MKIKEILNESEYRSDVSGVSDTEFDNITSAVDEINESSVFFHVKGVSFNTEALNEKIIKKCPCAIVASEDSEISSDTTPIIRVNNVRRTLAFAFFRFYKIDAEKLRFVGITGTNGKTTTASMIREILIADGKRVGFIGTGKIESDGHLLTPFDYSMTTPDPALLYSSVKRMQDDGCEYVIMEVSSHALALEKLAPISFEVAIFTNLSHEHLDFHKDEEEYFRTKMRLFDKCKLGIFNVDDEYARRGFSLCTSPKKSVGILWDADVFAKAPELFGFDGSQYLYRAENFIFKMNLKLVGAYNIYNSLCALCTAISLGTRPCVAKKALAAMTSPDGRFEIISDGELRVIIDYAHTPEAFENVLKIIKTAKNPEQKLITVFGCGGMRDKTKRPAMAKAAEKYSDFIVITEDNSRGEDPRKIIDDILKGINDKSRVAVIPSRKEALESTVSNASEDSVIAVLGKGAEKYNVDKNGTHPFDEKKIITDALKTRRGGQYEGHS